MNQKENIYSITQINTIIKEIFDGFPFFKDIYLKGEISNCRGFNKSGHLYFSLKDEKSSINAVMFKYDTFSLKFEPKNGDEVLVKGSISCYAPSGTYQIICKEISLFGIGEQLLKKELLKQKLYQEGIFDNSHKLKLPNYPEKIAIITGKNSAAMKDFEFNINRRFPLCELKAYYSLVQGEEAPKDLIKNLNNAIKDNPDLIIIGRGGGSLEDLSAFDDENLVRAIYNANIPIISAIGHEINLSLCDLVADKYASTPTGAAEIAVPNIEDILYDISQQKSYLTSIIQKHLTSLENKLLVIKNNDCFKDITLLFESSHNKVKSYSDKLNHILTTYLISKEHELELLNDKLNLLNPNNVLKKGYSIMFNKKGEVIKNIKEVNIGDTLNIKTHDGTVISKVEEVK